MKKSLKINEEEPTAGVAAASDGVEEDSAEDDDGGLAAQSRKLRNSVISLAVFFVIVAGLLLGVPGLHNAAELMTDAKPPWVVLGGVLEVLSCLSYVVLFGLVFGRLGRSLSSKLSLAELAVNSVVSVSGLGGIALGAWVLRSKGVSVERIAKRSVLIFVLTSAVNVGAVVVIGVPMWLGLLPGSRNPLLTLLPAALAFATIVGTLLLARWARQAASQRRGEEGRFVVALVAVGGGVKDAVGLIRDHDWRMMGAVGYWLWDNLCLYACLAAYGSRPAVWAVAMAYLVGMMANSIPIPGGFFAVEGGLVGMLLLFGVRPASTALAAVVTYRVLSLWIPAIIGTAAFASMRREIGKPLRPQPRSAAGA
ncbi:MAG TPA: lysylphosphatidylglycerol synthase transmembrane domain-containing protein [Solirubrobacteraceae bacterium]|jgi:uncharacterized membrane protein YbhN (UPF0104 family)|nr:lysylphosphatidylglycerol synthase transmembrane domain-containing protein [Solirubrobacteraceae bacterium]